MPAKKYEQLTFSDDFMFCKVLQSRPDLCHDLLELILDEPIGEIVTVNKQYPVEITNDRRGVRFDVYAKDDNSVIYDIDMQNALKDHLPKRTRYIQGLVDLEQLERGSHFSELGRSFVIFICNFNLFPDTGRHRYSFRNICVEDRELELGDGTEKVFLCTKGADEDISPDLKALLDYVAGNVPESDFARRLESAVVDARKNPQWRKEYMDLQDYVDDARKEGIKEGIEKGLEKGRAEGIEKGLEKGRAEGLEKGLEKGHAEGLEKGLKKGREEGLEEGKSTERARNIKTLADNLKISEDEAAALLTEEKKA